MRVVSSNHFESLTSVVTKSGEYDALDYKKILSLLEGSRKESFTTVANGKKRALSPSARTPVAKRSRANSPTSSPGQGIQVYQHKLCIGYSAPPFAQQFYATEVREWMDAHGQSQDLFDLGELHLRRVEGRVWICPAGMNSLVMILPTLRDESEPSSYDFKLHPDLFVACAVLEEQSRVAVRAFLQLVPISVPSDDGALPFQILVELTVSLLPAITEPISSDLKVRARTEVEDAQRYALSQFFPPSLDVPADYENNTGIPFFLSTLQAAPEVSSPAVMEYLQPTAMVPTLLPFQRRSLCWLLSRENKRITENGEVISVPDSEALPLFWERVQILGRADIYYNRINGGMSFERPIENEIHGGILAEEPGLGKTLESIGLIMMNPYISHNPPITHWDPSVSLHVAEVKTSLIVTPSSLATQWVDEIKTHAPSLKVLVYQGWQKVGVPITDADAQQLRKVRTARVRKKGKAPVRRESSVNSVNGWDQNMMEVDDSESDSDSDGDDTPGTTSWCSYLNTFDICVTTYDVLRNDLGVARAPPKRPRRQNVVYSEIKRSRSPLIMVEWHRVIMDEVQMVGGGKTEEMVSLLPRRSSFAVSGTPARAQVSDLIHVLRFLRVEPVLASHIWRRLLRTGFAAQFSELFHRFGIRTKKDQVADELTIPSQTRYLVPIELGPVERQVYDQALERALDTLGLDMRGVASRVGWDVDVVLLRSWLRTLRGIATHPQVGQFRNQAERLLAKPGVLKSISEVLEEMRDQNWRTTCDERRQKARALVKKAQLMQFVEGNAGRFVQALEFLALAEKEVMTLLEEVRAAIAAHEAQGEIIKKETAAARSEQKRIVDDHMQGGNLPSAFMIKTREQVFEGDRNAEETVDTDEDYDIPDGQVGDAFKAKRSALSNRLRETQILMHQVKFWQGNITHNQNPDIILEVEKATYDAAETLRKDILKVAERLVTRETINMEKFLASQTNRAKTAEKDLHVIVPFCGAGGIRSAGVMEDADDFIESQLNGRSTVLLEWRSVIRDLLTRSLVVSDHEDATGEEYKQNLDTQGQAEAYLQAYAALVSDRREALTAERTTLAIVNTKEAKTRKTMAAQLASESIVNDKEATIIDKANDLDLNNDVLKHELDEKRKSLSERFSGRAVKTFIAELNGVLARILSEHDPEKQIVKEVVQNLRRLVSTQNEVHKRLEAELSYFRKAFNARINYFRQLQEISDSVVDAKWEGSLDDEIGKISAEDKALTEKINAGVARQRYLNNLTKEKEKSIQDEDEGICILCRCEILVGYLTSCGHIFCEECMKEWLSRRGANICPVCRTIVNTNQLQRFSNRPEPPVTPQSISREEAVPAIRRKPDYNFIGYSLFAHIQEFESEGSYGSKIQTLVQHLLYIQDADPGAKSIVFSAWADSLIIVQHALVNNGIACLRIDQTRNGSNAATQFRTDPTVLVLLLHGERENAGLNVTCASRVFLLESVVNHAFELQAIARVDRMGQRRETEVFCYYAEDTVERNILDLAARSGLSLYIKGNATGTISPTRFTTWNSSGPSSKMARSKKQQQKGDYIFSIDDMLSILFPHLYEDTEYLLPPTEVLPERRGELCNAVAGPSTLT